MASAPDREVPVAMPDRLRPKTLRPPSPGQLRTLRLIHAYIREHGYPPATRDIASGLGIRSTNAVNDFLVALERRGLLFRDPMVARGLHLTAEGAALCNPSGGDVSTVVPAESVVRALVDLRVAVSDVGKLDLSMLDAARRTDVLGEIRAVTARLNDVCRWISGEEPTG